ncbi:MAG: class II aldolase/adducin family protein [Bryobacteraceae bacterium]
MSSFDLTKHRVITGQDIEEAVRAGAKELLLREDAILTAVALDAARARGLSERRGARPAPAAAAAPAPEVKAENKWEKLFNSPEAEVIKEEICAVGRKLWLRQYVDGNGGNISCRLTDEAVICTPTLCSKYDLRPQDLCLVDLSGKQLAGGRPRTSEILLHLEIYKEVPEAKGVVHCHPAHATAYAITGRVPPTCVIPEFDVFVGKVAISPYETPGSQKFAETVIPFAKTHNTILLANHGIVCWADTVTHAEWFVEVTDTYCWTLMLAQQLGAPLSHFPPDKAGDLLAIKQKLGLPDARIGNDDCLICDLPEKPGGIALPPPAYLVKAGASPYTSAPAAGDLDDDTKALVRSVADAVIAALNRKA